MCDKNIISSEWQRDLVLLAKNTYVWLTQMSRKYSRPIQTLDQIPMEELGEIRSLGITGLWLVGVWERSPASRRIKQLYGHDHLIGSAYSIYRYDVASELGGESALNILKQKADKAGIILACDMVPNHTGLDCPWVLDHPDWYIGTFKKPVSTWEYNSQNLSPLDGVQIRIEDGYYTQQEAAEAFQYTTSSGFGPLYIYHGNDGTSMPWNDTAQLNYLNPRVREEVKQQILNVARRFKIIRLDAAMTLLRSHYKRLWYPDSNGKKFIPTRDANSMMQNEFDALMPNEFWAEVMEEIRSQAPDTLLLAEAFWLMEKYFIRNLGMHRVYNSAFLNHLRDENNSEFRRYLREIIESDPTLLESFINYLTTPDEAPAAESFGSADKYFGACTLMASMPGIPMFGHGQIEGFSESYGMDFANPMLNESSDKRFLAKHQESLSPLLLQRKRFTSTEAIAIFDLLIEDQTNEDVYIFSIISENKKSLIIFNNSNRQSVGRVIRGWRHPAKEGQSSETSLINGLHLTNVEQVRFTEMRTGEEKILRKLELASEGLKLDLQPYQSLVFDVD
jgi:hypothetical protein